MAKQQKKGLFLEKLRESFGIISTACQYCNISRRTYYDWLSADPVFKEGVSEIMETQIDRVEAHLLKLVSEGNPTAIIFYLKSKAKNRGYTEKTETVVSPGFDGSIEFKFAVAEPKKQDDKKTVLIGDTEDPDMTEDMFPPLEEKTSIIPVSVNPKPCKCKEGEYWCPLCDKYHKNGTICFNKIKGMKGREIGS